MRTIRLTIVTAIALAAGLLNATAQAAPATQEKEELSAILENSCTGEIIDFDYTIHVVTHVKKNGDVSQHIDIHGAGVSDLGVKYQLGAVQNIKTKGADFAQDTRIRLVGQGPSNNEFTRVRFKVVNGDIIVDEFVIECR